MAPTTISLESLRIPDDLVRDLRQNIAGRRIRAGFECLEANQRLCESFDSETRNAPEFLGYLAQWVDIGYGDAGLLREMLSRMPPEARRSLTVAGYIHTHMAEGLVAMADEEQSRAIPHIETALLLATETGDREIQAIANFWKARCHRKRGEYDDAFAHTIRARDLALECGFPRMAAVIRVLESWLQFQRGKHKEALATLREAETVLSETDDHVSLGNIQSTYGRICRQEGRLDTSVEHFARAIEEYRKQDPQHPNGWPVRWPTWRMSSGSWRCSSASGPTPIQPGGGVQPRPRAHPATSLQLDIGSGFWACDRRLSSTWKRRRRSTGCT